MKRKLLTLLLSLAMVVTMMPMTAVGSFAASTSPFTKAQLEEPFYFEAVADDGAIVSLQRKNEYAPAVNLLYKVNNGEWKDYELNSEVKLAKNDRVYFKAGSEENPSLKNTQMNSDYYSNSFNSKGETKLGGNIMSLLDGKNFSTMDKFQSGTRYSLSHIFCEGGDIVSAKDLILPAKELTSNCYESMFRYCGNLKEAPVLPATELATHCYTCMFDGCSSLESAPELKAEILKSSCYSEMFNNCESLKEAPELASKHLANGCYKSMFAGCSSLQTAPKLPATELKDNCYNCMFLSCTSLKEAPELPAKVMTRECYTSMFYGCTSLMHAPELPATSLSYGCYWSMFENCQSLVKAPVLPAKKTASSSYNRMFAGCESLNRIEVGFEEWNFFATTSWLNEVAEKGTFVCKKELAEKMNNKSFRQFLESEQSIPEGWTVCTDYFNRDELVEDIYENSTFSTRVNDALSKAKLFVKDLKNKLSITFDSGFGLLLPKDEIPFYIEAVEDDTKVKLFKETYGEPFEVHILCKVNNGKWQSISFDDGEVTLPNAGDRVYFKAGTEDDENVTNDHFASFNAGGVAGFIDSSHRFAVPKGSAELGGNIMSLLDGKNFSTKVTLPKGTEATFGKLFAGSEYDESENIVSAEDLILPATGLVQACYAQMFEYCVDLQKAPKLNAKTLQRSCYLAMFRGCTSLEKAPELPALDLAEACYSEMFRRCSSLKVAPKLPAQELCDGCYYWMFGECTRLEDIELPAKEAEYWSYHSMFRGCNSLKTIKLGLKSCGQDILGGWLSDASETGQIICTPEFLKSIQEIIEAEEDNTDVENIPEGWKLVSEHTNDSSLKESIWTIISFPTRMFNILTTADIVLKKVGILSFLGLSK